MDANVIANIIVSAAASVGRAESDYHAKLAEAARNIASTVSESDPNYQAKVAAAARDIAAEASKPDPNYQVKIAAAALDIAALANPRSGLAEQVAKVLETEFIFPATVVGVKKEASSTRGLVYLRTKPSERYADGIEPGRTERTDNPAGRAIARKAVGLIGHNVLVYRVNEKAGANSVRVIVNLIDLGPAPDKAALVANPITRTAKEAG